MGCTESSPVQTSNAGYLIEGKMAPAGHGPGRLGDVKNILKTDPRADPRVVKALAPFGLDGESPPAPLTTESPREEILKYLEAAEGGFGGLFDAIYQGVDPIAGVTQETKEIDGPDQNKIKLYITKPDGMSDVKHIAYHIHGGGMGIMRPTVAIFKHWRDALAAKGVMVVGVDFRNAAGEHGNHPFPAGLNDCVKGVQWCLNTHKDAKIMITGDSGGGNLSIATTMKCKRDNIRVDGLYAQVPMIGGPVPRHASYWENDQLAISTQVISLLSKVYISKPAQAQDPLAFPVFATEGDLKGFPPTVVAVNELDIMRDEGLEFNRKLRNAGVLGYCRMTMGFPHIGEQLAIKTAPDVYDMLLKDVSSFLLSL